MDPFRVVTTLFRVSKRLRRRSTRRVIIPVPDQRLTTEWLSLRKTYFPERLDLDLYTICWSKKRQKRTLASCNIRKKLVNVAKEMSHPKALEYLPALLYHEMCHAALGEGIEVRRGKRMWHGDSFKRLEARHPGILELKKWMRAGGWHHVVLSERARVSYLKREKRSCA